MGVSVAFVARLSVENNHQFRELSSYRGFKLGRKRFGKFLLLLLLCNALIRYNTDVCRISAKKVLWQLYCSWPPFSVDSECVGRLLFQLHPTGFHKNFAFLLLIKKAVSTCLQLIFFSVE